jgi:ATP-dependent Clp protease ATP-binding subunit ClpC
LSVSLTKGAKEYLLEKGYDAKNGVRPLRRLIQDTIEDQMAVELLDQRYQKGDIVHVGTKNDQLTYSTANE